MFITDPLSLDGTYFGLHNTGAVGSRDHGGVGAEFSAPLFSTLTMTGAGRYDHYDYSSNGSGKFTYALGLECLRRELTSAEADQFGRRH